ncbi:MAG: hypothetical protein KGQ41_04400 [Alphaproteobacteria bacterium]|nr:hypothetical protein [Alphaproteobacteria bacterium]
MKAKSRKIQSGYWDRTILCEDCDKKILGRYDTYGKKFFSQDFSSKIKTINDPRGNAEYLHITNFDYSLLKLFLLSVIWRASICKKEQFSSVNLGSYEEIIKDMIFSTKLTHENDTQIAMFTWKAPPKGLSFSKAIISPFKRNFGADVYSLVMAGFEILIKVSPLQSSIHMDGFNVVKPEGFVILSTDFEASAVGKVTKKIRQRIQEAKYTEKQSHYQ